MNEEIDDIEKYVKERNKIAKEFVDLHKYMLNMSLNKVTYNDTEKVKANVYHKMTIAECMTRKINTSKHYEHRCNFENIIKSISK